VANNTSLIGVFGSDMRLPLERQREISLLTRLVFGEARGEPIEGKIAVAQVAMNRWANKRGVYGRTLREVILRPKQFSCFNISDVNYIKITKPREADAYRWKECNDAARIAYLFATEDVTLGSTHYTVRGCDASWISKMKENAVIGNHVFMSEKSR